MEMAPHRVSSRRMWGQPDTDPRALPYAVGFELSEGFNKGQLHGAAGWSVDQGKAIIGIGKELPFIPRAGDQLAIIEEGQGLTTFSQGSLGFLPPINETVTFIDFYVLPEALIVPNHWHF